MVMTAAEREEDEIKLIVLGEIHQRYVSVSPRLACHLVPHHLKDDYFLLHSVQCPRTSWAACVCWPVIGARWK